MYYYIIHLALGIRKDFVYTSMKELKPGSRVVVSFNRKLCLGISGERQQAPSKSGFRYLSVEEVLDDTPIIDEELYGLAAWMADYYHCSMGKALFAILPSYLQPDVDSEIKLISDRQIPEHLNQFCSLLDVSEYRVLSKLHKENPSLSVYRLTEQAEELGIVELKRKLRHKDKQKTVNYLRIIKDPEEPEKLPAKQLEAYALLKHEGDNVPMSRLAQSIAYSTIKSLVSKGIIEIYPRKLDNSSPFYDSPDTAKEIILNDEQQAAIKAIREGYGKFDVNLLYGITGSGKTEVYLEMIRDYLKDHKTIIFLIPEIALTPQMVDRFSASFGDVLAIMHSQLTERERLQQWQRIRNGECRIVIGARSAIFSPLQKLGLIIVDEEHEQSYKQDNVPRYNGRDLAIVRAKMSGAQVILGSATPSLESWYNAQNGKYRLHMLNSRPLSYTLPTVKIIDLCDEYSESLLSNTLVDAIAQRLERKEQIILFQNRRGYSSYIQCLKCGDLIKCANCEISMYYHRDREEMHCHYCGNNHPIPRKCPHCGSHSFSYGAPGTQKLEQIISLLFPDARILRMDSDTTRERDRYKTMYSKMKNHETDILLGTQMISKGLDFPGVTLVGIVNADISLNIPDFRAAERTFQLITQVAGRSGRGELKGEVIIQTYNPDHYSIVHASNQDYKAFAKEEMDYRMRLYYPPYYRLCRIVWQSSDKTLLMEEMERLQNLVPELLLSFPAGQVLILGPILAPLGMVNKLHRYHMIIKAATAKHMSSVLVMLEKGFSAKSKLMANIDIDPTNLM